MNRRDVLKGAGLFAGALALPPALEAAGQAFDTAMPVALPCLRCAVQQKPRRAAKELESALYNRLYAQLTTAQQDLLADLQDAWNEQDAEEQAQFVGELARHLPGLGPVIVLVTDHLWQQRLDEVGVCCEDTA